MDSKSDKDSQRDKRPPIASNHRSRLRHAMLDSAFGPAALGAALWWLALPPLEWFPLAWLAAAPWTRLIVVPQLPGRRPYRAIWLAGFLFWVTMLQWLRYAHPAAALGGIFLSAYLAVYLPLLIALSRVAVHRWRTPAIVATPIVWAGLELIRAHLLTGFTLGSLAHTQYRWLEVLQLAELGGAPLLGALVAVVGACLAMCWPIGQRKRFSPWPLAVAGSLLAAAVWYGTRALSHPPALPGPTVALVQAPIKTEVKHDPAKKEDILRQYLALSVEAVRQHPQIELVVWPETMFRDTWLTWTADVAPPADADWTIDELHAASRRVEQTVADTARQIGRDWILGTDVLEFGPGRMNVYNSALLVDRHGTLRARYDKMHPVMFGEYVPLGTWMPWLYKLTPLPLGLTPGTRREPFVHGEATASVNICYELFVPHLLRQQVAKLEADDGPAVTWVLNLTNNGYYGGSWELELHLISAVFRAAELRRSVLVAANGGISAWVDSDGRIQARGGRQSSEVVLARPSLENRAPSALADAFGWSCAAVCVALAGAGLWHRFRAVT